ncbi:MAG: hypothetical protein RBR97_20375, partial [Bacteroidales bacterium]|nr:hypothetical protein [Bacteroidales bacterium]
MQAEASACVSGLANVQFCAWAVHYFVFLFLSLSSKLFAVSLSFYTCAQRMRVRKVQVIYTFHVPPKRSYDILRNFPYPARLHFMYPVL